MEQREGQACDLAPGDQDPRTRERLLRAAADVFDRKGYAAASVREIVERAGITKPGLYYHFGSKEGMLVAILEAGALLFERTIADALERPGDVRTRLAAMCEGIYGLFRENIPAVRVAHAVYFGPREGLPAFDFARFEKALGQGIRRLVAEGIAAGELRPAPVDDVARAIIGIINGCTDQELSQTETPAGIDGIHRVLDLVFAGLSPSAKKEN